MKGRPAAPRAGAPDAEALFLGFGGRLGFRLAGQGRAGACCEQGIRVESAARRRVDAVVEVRQRGCGIAGVSDVADHRAGLDPLPLAHITPAFQVRVVVPPSGRPGHPYRDAPQPIRPQAGDIPFRRRQDRRVLLREDVDPLMLPPAAARISVAQRWRAQGPGLDADSCNFPRM